MSACIELLESRRLFSGPGADPAVVIDGVLRPGNSPGAVTFGGDLVFGPSATLEIELAGTVQGTQYDVVHVGGRATLGGTLRVVLLDGFVPGPGQSFQVMTFGSRVGDFANYQGLNVAPGVTLRPVFSANALTLVAPPPGGPRVTGVFVSGSTWSAGFRTALQSAGLGDGTLGYAPPAGAAQLDELPWRNVDRVSVRFDRPVTADQADLQVRGTRVPGYAVNGYAYDGATNTATWSLARPLAADRILLDLNAGAGGVVDTLNNPLDGEWANGTDTYPSGDDAPGGDFLFRLNAVPGDADRSGRVTATDLLDVRRRLLRTAAGPGAGANGYHPFDDLDGSGAVTAGDVTTVRNHLLTTLPTALPTATLFSVRRIRAAGRLASNDSTLLFDGTATPGRDESAHPPLPR